MLPAFSQYITAGGQRFLNCTETETAAENFENASMITLSPLSAHALDYDNYPVGRGSKIVRLKPSSGALCDFCVHQTLLL